MFNVYTNIPMQYITCGYKIINTEFLKLSLFQVMESDSDIIINKEDSKEEETPSTITDEEVNIVYRVSAQNQLLCNNWAM